MPPAVTPDADDVPQEYALLVVDMKDYSKIPEAKMAPTLADLESILSTVFEQCGIDDVVTLDNAVKDRGDGSIYVLSSRHAARLVDPLLGHLKQALERREQSRLASSPPSGCVRASTSALLYCPTTAVMPRLTPAVSSRAWPSAGPWMLPSTMTCRWPLPCRTRSTTAPSAPNAPRH